MPWSMPSAIPSGSILTGGEAHDLVGADQLLPGMQADTLIGDKAFDAEQRVIEPLRGGKGRGDPAQGQPEGQPENMIVTSTRHAI